MPDRDDVEVNAGGPGSAIEDEGHRSLGGVRTLEGVADMKDLGIRVFGVLADGEHPGLGIVGRQFLRHRAQRSC